MRWKRSLCSVIYLNGAVAEMVIDFAKKSHNINDDPRLSHVGYYLTGKGYVATAKAAHAKTTLPEKCRRFTNKFPLFVYLGSVLILTFLICWLLIAEASTESIKETLLVIVCIVSLMATTRLAVSLVNWLSTILSRPCLLPRMDYSKGIPVEARSMVVIPTLISSIEAHRSVGGRAGGAFSLKQGRQCLFCLAHGF